MSQADDICDAVNNMFDEAEGRIIALKAENVRLKERVQELEEVVRRWKEESQRYPNPGKFIVSNPFLPPPGAEKGAAMQKIEGFTPGQDSIATGDMAFIQHILQHLKPGEKVICKICGKTADEIIGQAVPDYRQQIQELTRQRDALREALEKVRVIARGDVTIIKLKEIVDISNTALDATKELV